MWESRRKGLDASEKERIKAVPALDPSDGSVRDYGVGDLVEGQKQGETDPSSPVVVPNHARSHDENGCRSGQKRARLEFYGVNSAVARTFRKIYPKIENPEDRAGRDPSDPSKGRNTK